MRCRWIDIIGLLLLLICTPLMAAKNNAPQPFYIESDELEIDDRRGVSEYRGSVRFSQGGIQLQADKVVVMERKRRLQRVVAHGQLVRLNQKTAAGEAIIRAEAEKIEYLPEADSLLLEGRARLWQGGNEFSGNVIEYHLKNETVIARSDKEKPGRVRIVIQPKEDMAKPVPESASISAQEKEAKEAAKVSQP